MISKHEKRYRTDSRLRHCTSLILGIGAFFFPMMSSAQGEIGSENLNLVVIMPSGTQAVEFRTDQYLSLIVRDATSNAPVAEIPLPPVLRIFKR